MNNPSLYYPIVNRDVRMVGVRFVDPGKDPYIEEGDHFIIRDEEQQGYRYRAKSSLAGYATKLYTYKTLISFKPGDLAVAEAGDTHAVVMIEKVNVPIDFDSHWSFRWIVSKIDLEPHKILLQREQEVIEEVQRLKVDNARGKMLEALGINQDQVRNLLTGAHAAHMPKDDGPTEDHDPDIHNGTDGY